MVNILLGLLAVLLLYFLYFYVTDLAKNKNLLGSEGHGSFLISGAIGLLTNFLDTLGIGSFAPLTALLDFTKQLENDKVLPGTLNVSCTIPVMLEAFIFIRVVEVDPFTLFTMVVAAILGSFFGSKLVSGLPEKKVQLGMGVALIITAVLMALKQQGMLDILGEGNTATKLVGARLIIGLVVNFFLGGLMTLGVGLYAPCMALVYMLGLSPLVAFPIMMASCAGLMPVASAEFIKAGQYSKKVALAITLGGVIGVIIAVKFVTSLPMNVLTWVVICVVLYTAITYIVKGTKQAA